MESGAPAKRRGGPEGTEDDELPAVEPDSERGGEVFPFYNLEQGAEQTVVGDEEIVTYRRVR